MFYKIKEVCEMLQISRQTLYQWIKDGKIKTVKINKLVRIPEEEIKKFIV
jgi:excisionase family DNA binding protein